MDPAEQYPPDTVPPELIAEAAEACAAYIERHGLHKGGLGGPGTSCCAMGVAVAIAQNDHHEDRWTVMLHVEREVERLIDRTRVSLADLKHPIAQWNDHPDTTAADVIGVFTDIAIKHRDDAMEVTGE